MFIDVDGDGDMDVLSADKIWMRMMEIRFYEQIITTNANGAWSVFATDVDLHLEMMIRLPGMRMTDKSRVQSRLSQPMMLHGQSLQQIWI